jgi:hypothetical protein
MLCDSRSTVISLGTILFVMCAGFLPFSDDNTDVLIRKIVTGDWKHPKWFSEELQDVSGVLSASVERLCWFVVESVSSSVARHLCSRPLSDLVEVDVCQLALALHDCSSSIASLLPLARTKSHCSTSE